MGIIEKIQNGVVAGVKSLYGADFQVDKVPISSTRKEFEGDYTVVVFPFTKIAKLPPAKIADALGNYLVTFLPEVTAYNVVNGFLNLLVDSQYWVDYLENIFTKKSYGRLPRKNEKVMVEFSSPNTNKPLHLGHIRNILLGWSVSQILDAAGYDVIKTQIINDRGIAICKSMVAWMNGDQSNPEKSGMKGDHLVGKYYVAFDQAFKVEYLDWQSTPEAETEYANRKKVVQTHDEFFKDYKNEYFNKYSKLGKQAKDLLLKWEAGDEDVLKLWNEMNSWVYAGFEQTYNRLGVDFDKTYYESETYLLGKKMVDKGLKDGVFYTKEDGSVWIDLTDRKLDHKIVLRSDGTSVYLTQDLGTADLRYQDFGTKQMIYTVGDEQNYHFKVLFETLKKLKTPYADGLFHLSYGMVDLPTGRMKSREGTVVDADDLMNEVVGEAKKGTAERGDISSYNAEQQMAIIEKIGLSALKYFILKVNPQKRMVFNPTESVDMQGNTGPYIQNAYVRILSILRKAGDLGVSENYKKIHPLEKELIKKLYAFPEAIETAAKNHDPSEIAGYNYELAKMFHRFYHDLSIIRAESEAAKAFRMKLSMAVANVLKLGMGLLGIEMPERM